MYSKLVWNMSYLDASVCLNLNLIGDILLEWHKRISFFFFSSECQSLGWRFILDILRIVQKVLSLTQKEEP